MTGREVAELYRNAGFTPPQDIEPSAAKISKHRATRKIVDGKMFASSLEATAYQVLRMWELAGAIRELTLQPPFVLQEKFRDEDGKAVRAIKYLGDFRFFDVAQGRTRYVDVKGRRLDMFRLKHKILKRLYPEVELELWDLSTVKDLARR